MRLPTSLIVVLLSVLTNAASDSKPALKPCTIHVPTTGAFIDLRPLQLALKGTKTQEATNASYVIKGHDYPANFSLNFCAPVLEELDDVDGVPERQHKNVSAFYTDKRGDTFSIGQQNSELLYRGRKLLLNYTNGSPCPAVGEGSRAVDVRELDKRKKIDEDHDDNEPEEKQLSGRRKNTQLIFTCDTSPLVSTKPSFSFVGTPDECTYIFEVRSRYACGGATGSDEKGTLGPGAVFGVILSIALLVYFIGGVVYQRSVMHQRGWKQIPNYSMWAGISSFVSVSKSD